MSILYTVSENGLRNELHVLEHIEDNSEAQDFYVENGCWEGTYHNGEIFVHYTGETFTDVKIDNSDYE